MLTKEHEQIEGTMDSPSVKHYQNPSSYARKVTKNLLYKNEDKTTSFTKQTKPLFLHTIHCFLSTYEVFSVLFLHPDSESDSENQIP